MTIKLNTENIDKKVVDLIIDKQAEFKKEKGRVVSLDKTVERLLKEAYIKKQFMKNWSLFFNECLKFRSKDKVDWLCGIFFYVFVIIGIIITFLIFQSDGKTIYTFKIL